jgi:hypothetical protein
VEVVVVVGLVVEVVVVEVVVEVVGPERTVNNLGYAIHSSHLSGN